MFFFANIMLMFLNLGLTVGLVIGALILLRPLLVRLLRPQQRVVLWMVAWVIAYLPAAYQTTNFIRVLPVTFRDLVVPRTGAVYDLPAYLPDWFEYSGTYNLALPGGAVFPVSLGGWGMLLLFLVWVGGLSLMLWIGWRKDQALRAMAVEENLLREDDPLLQTVKGWTNADVGVYLCSGLPTSFVVRGSIADNYRYSICLQDDLPRERLDLVLRHEVQHIRLKHCYFKFYATAGVNVYWWNPLVWLGYRYFCRDMELACDEAVMKELATEDRREYARTLVELGSGRQLWESGLSFGECDAALRVKAAVNWKHWPWWKWAGTWCLTVLAILFFVGGPRDMTLREDVMLYYQRYIEANPAYWVAIVEKAADRAGVPGERESAQVWLWMDEQGSAGWLYFQLEDGSWYETPFLHTGRRPYLVGDVTGERVQPPNLTNAIQIQ